MRKLSLAAALVAAAVVVPLSIGSSHREAPSIMLDPSADNTDLYAFTAPDAQGALTVAANWIPGQNPANGPNFFRWDPKARYYVNFDNTGDGKWDVRYLFRFKTSVKNKESFLYAGPGTTSYDGLNVRENYTVTREKRGKGGKVSKKVVGRGLPVAPPNIGPKTLPNYQAFADGAIRTLSDGTKLFVGQRDDPFFVDLGGTFDAINIRKGTGNEGLGKDDFSGMSISAVVMQLPERLVTKNGQAVARPTRTTRSWASGRPPSAARSGVQARLGRSRPAGCRCRDSGNPLVNEVVIPLGQKDRFNRTKPDQRRRALRQVRREAGAGRDHERAVQRRRAHGRPHGHRAARCSRASPNLNQHKGIDGPPAVDTLEDQPRRASRVRRPGPLRRDRWRHRRVPERPQARGRRGRHRAAGRGRDPRRTTRCRSVTAWT